jgi:hypothetical protein
MPLEFEKRNRALITITIGRANKSSALSVFSIKRAIVNPAPIPKSTPINKNLFVLVGMAASKGKAGI